MKKKTICNVRQFVKMRFKSLACGRKSIYLDTYVKGKRSYEFLKLYLVPENDEYSKSQNRQTLLSAEKIRVEREQLVISQKEEMSHSKLTLSQYLERYCREMEKFGKKRAERMKHVCRMVRSCASEMRLVELDKGFYQRFDNYLSTQYRADKRCEDGKLGKSTRKLYLAMLNTAINDAVRKGFLLYNPFDRLSKSERIGKVVSERQFLTIAELQQLSQTPMPRKNQGEVKKAYMFSCFCGLRLSDIIKLRWENFSMMGDRLVLDITVKKTGKRLILPISKAARQWLAEGTLPESGKVFNLPITHTIQANLRRWAKAAGIDKYLTFHTSRHTFATLMITLGADIFTVSKLLGHSDLRTTQLYARIIDKKKEAAVDLANSVL